MLLSAMGLKTGGKYHEPELKKWHRVKVDDSAYKPSNWGEAAVLAGHGSIFTKYEEDVESGRRPPGPIEAFAFSTMSRRGLLPLTLTHSEAVPGSFRRVDLSVAAKYDLSVVHWYRARRIGFLP